MRERWARALALATGVLLVLIAAALAQWQNRTPPGARPGTATVAAAPGQDESPAQTERGRALYAELRCANCHAIAGVGNPRVRLDGVGQSLDATQLRHWIVADPAVADAMSNRVRIAKTDYRSLPDADLDALVAYLQSLPATPELMR